MANTVFVIVNNGESSFPNWFIYSFVIRFFLLGYSHLGIKHNALATELATLVATELKCICDQPGLCVVPSNSPDNHTCCILHCTHGHWHCTLSVLPCK